MDNEAHRHQPVDDVLGLRLFGAFLHDEQASAGFQYTGCGARTHACGVHTHGSERQIYGVNI